MQLIKNNPYRTIGLLVGATAREQERQIKRLKQFVEAEQNPQEDFSFPTLGELHRTIDNINDAASKLNLGSDKMGAALFWFYNGNAITDEPALDYLKEADQQKCREIWTKLTGGDITQRNSSAYQNLSTLLLCNAINGTTIDLNQLEHSIALKLKFLDSDYTKDFKDLVTDATYKITKEELQVLFLSQVQSELDRNDRITPELFLDILNRQDFLAKEVFLKGFVQKPIELIERNIESAKAGRKADKADAAKYGQKLYEQTFETILQLKAILGISNMSFSSVSDKVSDEILQCGIDYFSFYRDSKVDPGNVTRDLFNKANNLAVGNIAKQRCQENTENLQEWIESKPEREKQQRIKHDFEKLGELIDEYERKSETVANAKQLLLNAKPHLNNIKLVLGSSDELYLVLSSRIASDAQGMCVSEINRLQDKFTSTHDSASKLASILILKERVDSAWEVTSTIGSMDLRQDFRDSCISNRNVLSNLKSQLSQVGTNVRNNSGNSSGGGCYIATMAYGSYDHPQVMILRQFRNEVLSKTNIGRYFITIYYFISPKLVGLFKKQKVINVLIRKMLDQIIKLIK